MASIMEPNADLTKLSERLRVLAELLRNLPAGHVLSSEDRETLRKELKAIAAKLLSVRELSRPVDQLQSRSELRR